MQIEQIIGRQILDSRGIPTLEVDVYTSTGVFGRASVPSGSSVGEHEAVELRDGDNKYYFGKSVFRAVENINKKLAPKIIGELVTEQRNIDRILIEADGTPNKSNYGANAILGISLAVAKAAAHDLSLPLYRYIGGVNARTLPVPMMNIVNGGSHSDAPIAFQEFMIVPVKAKDFSISLRMGVEIFHSLKKVIHNRGLSTAVGDEGGFAPKFEGIEDTLETIMKAIKNAGYKAGEQIKIALDVAASEFYKDGIYDYRIFEGENGVVRSSEDQISYLENLSNQFPIISIEDGMDQNDWNGWKRITEKIGDRIQLVGDDLFVTNVNRLSRGIKEKIGNSILIKVNQIGTLSETIDAVEMAKNAGFTAVMSHRSGETEDSTIADLAVALGTGQIKTGSASRSDRMAKYNQLLRIEEQLGKNAYFPEINAFKVNMDFV